MHRYLSEAELAKQLELFLRATAKGSYEFYSEHEAGFGRPDVLLCSRAPDSSRDIAALALLRPWIAPLLSAKASEQIDSVDKLAIATGTSPQQAIRFAKQLEAIGRLTWISHAAFEIFPIVQLPFPIVVAIEIKLRDWRRALVQAYRYRNFSTESWVVLDHTMIEPALRSLARFDATGVGLASFSTDHELHIHAPAKPHQIPNGPLAWRTQSVLAQL